MFNIFSNIKKIISSITDKNVGYRKQISHQQQQQDGKATTKIHLNGFAMGEIILKVTQDRRKYRYSIFHREQVYGKRVVGIGDYF